MKKLILLPNHWYACEFIHDVPFTRDRWYSPIRVKGIKTWKDGSGRMDLAFFHANYPEGVQDKVYSLRILVRSTHVLVAACMEPEGRILVIHKLDWTWMRAHFTITHEVPTDPREWLDRTYPTHP